MDEVTSYFGMRKIALGKDDKGVTRLMLNGKFVFQVGPLDQGFWPDGIYTAPTDEALRWDIEMHEEGSASTASASTSRSSRTAGITGATSWACWSGRTCPAPIPTPASRSRSTRSSSRPNCCAWSRTIGTIPAIIMWVMFNEGCGTARHRGAGWLEVKDLDPSRLVNNASGWTDKHCGDVIDMHNYPGPGSPQPEAHRAAVLGEFGGLGLAVDGHTWSKTDLGLQRHAKLRGPDPQLRKTARQSLGAEGQGRSFGLHLHAAHRRGDRVQRAVDLRPRGAQGDPRARRRGECRQVPPVARHQGSGADFAAARHRLAIHAGKAGRRLDQARLR